MAFFRSLDKQSQGAREFNEIIVGLDGLSYVSASAIKNSDVFTAVRTAVNTSLFLIALADT